MALLHRQVPLRFIPGHHADAEIPPVVEFLAAPVCLMYASCQGASAQPQVAFVDGQSLLTAVQALAALAEDAGNASLQCRVLKTTTFPCAAVVVPWEQLWTFEVRPQ